VRREASLCGGQVSVSIELEESSRATATAVALPELAIADVLATADA
jgi:hypothetical protein